MSEPVTEAGRAITTESQFHRQVCRFYRYGADPNGDDCTCGLSNQVIKAERQATALAGARVTAARAEIAEWIEENNARVAAADAAHVAEPMPRNPHEGDYPRGQRDALESVLALLGGGEVPVYRDHAGRVTATYNVEADRHFEGDTDD